MKKTLKRTVALLALFVGVVIANSASAAIIEETTDVDVSVTAGEVVRPVVDPPEGNDGGPGNGSSSFQFWLKPKAISFEELKVSTFNQNLSPKLETDRFLAVADLRGEGEGYTVQAKMTTPMSTTDSSNKLTGAKVKWTQEAINFTNPAVNYDYAPDNSELVLGGTDIELGQDNIKLFTAPVTKGQGYFGVKFLPNTLKLNVPGMQGSAGHNYSSTITWTLNDAPL